MKDDGAGVDMTFSDGVIGRSHLVVGADGIFARTRQTILPDAPTPEDTGRYGWLSRPLRFGSPRR